jgi:cell division septation protein DedD|tara:strand:+ start:41 stop:520 length:480 start_codon:yes stop_codon:yes gene_type:complete
MNIERIVGLVFSISTLLILLFVVLTPQVDYQQDFKIIDSASKKEEIAKIEFEEKSTEIEEKPLNPKKEIISDAANIDRSDFDLFVLRVHVLSSEDNAKKMVTKINEGGFPAFTEIFGAKKNLHAVYVGPFIEESDINQNIELIQKVSESQNGEISRWKL